MRRSAGLVGQFRILLHEGHVPGLTKKVVKGTRMEAQHQLRELEEKLSDEQREAGWWYELEEEITPPLSRINRLRRGRRERGRVPRRDYSRR